jgi:uncharacterized protein (TIGR02598 family)
MKRRPVISYQSSVIGGNARGKKLKADSQKPKAANGFSLMEVTLAVAVVAIGLIAILGLIPQGVQSSRDAADNTLAATIVQDTFNDLRTRALGGSWPPAAVNIYYDAVGTNSFLATSTSLDRYFHVVATPVLSASTPDLYVVTATISWPATSASPLNTNVFVTQIARYQ